MTDCLSCRHAKPIVEPGGRINFAQRVCQEGPPIPLIVGLDANRQPMVQAFFPVVTKGVRCDRHDDKLVGENGASIAEWKPQ